MRAPAAAPGKTDLDVQIRRVNAEGVVDTKILMLATGTKPFYVDYVEKALNSLPRGRTKENKIQTVIFIIVAMGIFTIIRCLAKFYQDYMAQKVVQI